MRISDWSSDVCSSDLLADPNFEAQPYDPWVAYGRSKTANILFAVEFDRRHKARAIRAAAVHPGAIATDLGRDVPPEQMEALFKQRSDERRVGKECVNSCRSRLSPCHLKQKKLSDSYTKRN